MYQRDVSEAGVGLVLLGELLPAADPRLLAPKLMLAADFWLLAPVLLG